MTGGFSKPAIRTEGLLPAETIVKIITDELTALPDVPAAVRARLDL